MTTFRISGNVVDQRTHTGLSGLRVEAWDKDLLFDDMVGSAITDEQGAFQIVFDETYLQELFLISDLTSADIHIVRQIIPPISSRGNIDTKYLLIGLQ